MIGALTAPDRLGLLDSRAAARYECDARASTCPSHAHACDGTIAFTIAGGTLQWHALSAADVSLACWHAIRSHARYAVVFVGAVSADMCHEGRYPAAMVASALVGDAEVMSGLGRVQQEQEQPCRLVA